MNESKLLTTFNDKNSTINKETNEITLTKEKLVFENDIEIDFPCRLLSKINTEITCENINITSKNVYIEGITFKGSINITDIDNVQIINCEVKDTSSSEGAISITNSKEIKLSHVHISNIKSIPGIYITKESDVTADNLTIHDIDETLLVCNSSSVLKLKDSNLYTTKANGIYINKSNVDIQNCKVSETDYPAIFISESECVVKNNEITNIAQNGISLNICKSFVVSRNTLKDVKGSAISILDESVGKASRNIITDIGGNGIYIGGNSDVKACKNVITNSQYPGIAVLMKSEASLIKNKITKVTYSGICCRGAKHVKIIKSELNDIQECGVSVSDTKKCVIKHCTFTNCNVASVESYNNSKVYVIENEISDMKNYGFTVYTSGYLKAKNNNISKIGKAMVNLQYRGGGVFVDNQLTECDQQRDGQTSAIFLFSGNGNFDSFTNDKEKETDSVKFIEEKFDFNSTCIKCHKNPRNCFLLDCGHKVYCKSCAEEAKENNQTCPLCRFPIASVTEGFEANSDDMCVICFEKSADSIVSPCAHMGFCHHCLEHWFKSNKNCPICRAEPASFKKIIDV